MSRVPQIGNFYDTGDVLNIRSMFQVCNFFASIAAMETTTHIDDTANNVEINHQIRQKWGNAVGKGGLTGYLALPEALIFNANKTCPTRILVPLSESQTYRSTIHHRQTFDPAEISRCTHKAQVSLSVFSSRWKEAWSKRTTQRSHQCDR